MLVAIWLLLNVLFVIVRTPPRKPQRPGPASRAGAHLAPATIDKDTYPFEDDEKVSLRHIIVSVGMGAFFMLSPFLLEAIEAAKRFIQRDRV